MFTVQKLLLNDVTSQDEKRHHFAGSCSDVTAQSHIRSTYLSILRAHEMSRMCESERFEEECRQDFVSVSCAQN